MGKSSLIKRIRKGLKILHRRLSEQGPITTLIWVYARGVPLITGIPLLQYSKITDNIYVGPQFNHKGLAHLQRNGIYAVVNLRIEFDDTARGLTPPRYCYLPVVDDTSPTIEQLETGVKFIQEIMDGGGSVYIHCGAGVGRAPTMAAAYFISSGCSLDEAIRMIRKVRPFIYLMPAQMEQLRNYSRLKDRL